MRRLPGDVSGRIGLAAAAAGAVLRIAVASRLFEPAAAWIGDARVYLRTTEALTRGSWIPEAWIWPPGLPFLSLPFSFPFGAAAGLAVASLLWGAVLPFVLLWAGRAAGAPWAGAVAAAWAAFDPEAVLAAGRPLSDAPAITLVAAVVALVVSDAGPWRRVRAVLAGLAGAVATLVRPETLAVVAAVPVVCAVSPRLRRAALPCAVALVVGLLPWAAAFRAATGAWGLSLKPQVNLLKAEAYGTAADYGAMRDAWGRALDAHRDASGALDPRSLATASDVRGWITSGEMLAHWRAHATIGWQGTPVAVRITVVSGLVGLVVAPFPWATRALFLAMALPFAGVPLFVAPLGRFLLPLLPATALGWGALAQHLAVRAGTTSARRAVSLAAMAAAVVLAFTAGRSAWIRSGAEAFHGRASEIEAALGEGRLDDAERQLAIARPRFGGRVQFLELEARLLDACGRPDEAERSFRAAVAAGGSPVGLAEHLARGRRFEEAESLLAPLRADPPASPNYWLLEGNLAFMRNRIDEALRCWDRAETAGAPAGEIAFNRGSARAAAGDVEGAAREWRRAAAEGTPATAARAREALAKLAAPAER